MDTFLIYASRGRNAWWRYVASSVIACLFAGFVIVAISVALLTMHVLTRQAILGLQRPADAPAFFLGIFATFGAFLIGWIAATALVQKKKPKDIVGRWRWRAFFWGFVAWTAIQCATSLADFLLSPKGFALSASVATAKLFGFALLGLGVQSFAEEFVFRGFLTQGILLMLKRPFPAAIVSGLMFGAVHIPNGTAQAVNAALFGIVCSYLAIRTGGIALTYGIHLSNNLFGAVAVVSASDVFSGSPGIFVQNTPQLRWWDTAVSAACLIALAVYFVRRNIAPTAAAKLLKVEEKAATG